MKNLPIADGHTAIACQLEKVSLSWVDFLPTIAVVLSAFAAAYWAYKTIKSQETIAKKRSTMEFVMRRSRDSQLVEGWFLLRQLDAADNIDIKAFCNSGKEIDINNIVDTEGEQMTCKKVRVLLSYVLNQYEYMSAGIDSSIYDEKILYNCSRNTTVRTYEMTKAFIEELQKNKPDAYKNFSTLAKKWNKKPFH